MFRELLTRLPQISGGKPDRLHSSFINGSSTWNAPSDQLASRNARTTVSDSSSPSSMKTASALARAEADSSALPASLSGGQLGQYWQLRLTEPAE
ncbi:hypothetical protein [Nonomuraea sp. SYSU D8015]|uniref:hypothetical protein n=1 Tax=Nonomuraea sp. SYSU D8015 TaxID=2593644 RepID=UPI0016600DA0|nr:hypothetical protein [Nonomuraea sp. SYSU D8015]